MPLAYSPSLDRKQQDLSDYSFYGQLIDSLSVGERRLIGYLGSFYFANKSIFPSIKTMSKETSVPSRTVDNFIAKIKGLGIMHVLERCWNSSNVYGFNKIFNTKRGKSLIWRCVKEYKKFKENNCVLTVKLRNNIYKKIDNIRREVVSTYADAWDFIFNKGRRKQKRERYKLAMDKIEQARQKKRNLENSKWQCENNDVMYGYGELKGCNVSRIFEYEEIILQRREAIARQDAELARRKAEGEVKSAQMMAAADRFLLDNPGKTLLDWFRNKLQKRMEFSTLLG
jgi:hypothetical protein